LNLRTMAFAAVALIAFGTSAVSFAQAPGAAGTPPPPPVPAATSSPLISTSPQPTPLPAGEAAPTSPGMTPTPVPVPFASPSESPSASPSPESRGRRGRHPAGEGASPGPSPTETPEPPQFSTLDGVWEIALQPLTGARTIYSHLYVTQSGNSLTGTWKRDGKTPALPFTGTFDGRLFKITVTDGSVTRLLSGYEENYSDMVGLLSDGDPQHQGTPFTAAHRKREHDSGVRAY
jgi:hypothetical protein